MSLQLFGLLFGSYTWTVLTALWADEADETPSKIRMLNLARCKRSEVQMRSLNLR